MTDQTPRWLDDRTYEVPDARRFRCVYCKNPADGTLHDAYGELMLGGSLIVCAECDKDFQHEDGPWNEVH